MDNKPAEPQIATEDITLENPELLSLKEHKEEAENWQKRRHSDWTENYTLYRDRVVVNRLTQRQSVNVPLMKTVIKTALKETDDPPILVFESIDNNKQKDIFFNAYWEEFARLNKLTIKDIVDKKQVMFYGRSFKKLNLVNGKPVVDIVDPQDIKITRYTDPTMINQTRYLVHEHIFVPLSTLEHNEDFDQEAVQRLKTFYATDRGLIKAADNLKSFQDRQKRMQTMGVIDVLDPRIGETYVELNEHYLMQWNEDHEQEEYYIIVTAEDREIMMKKTLEEHIGVTRSHYFRTHNVFNSWADDVELTDIWSDALADIIRIINKVANIWISQMIENRTLRNFSMFFFDSTIEGFQPQTYEPVPFGQYPAPGNPNQTMMQVTIPDLGNSVEEMQFLMNLGERAAATPDMTQGVVNKKTMTKAEMQAVLSEAQDRVRSMSIYYNDAWEEFGELFINFIEANQDRLEPVKVVKKGYKGTIFTKVIDPNDWKTKDGYVVKVMTKDQKDKEEQKAIEKLNAISPDFQNNQAFQNIRKKKELAFAGLNPDEVKEVIDYEEQMAKNPQQPQVQPQQQQMQLPARAGQ